PSSSAPLASAELYDPVAHSFTTISPMHAARVDQTMTLLPDGTVLVAGGFNTTGALSSAEIYDPVANSFTLLGATMTSIRSEHSATLLANGKVLIAGGNNNTASLSSAEIYDPVAQTFTAIAARMSTPRQIQHADLLPNGTVLISGGLDASNTALASAEIYDPVAGTFTPTGSMTTARGNHVSALLYTGKVLVAGGLTGPGTALVTTATAEIYDPSTGAFTPTGSMSVARGHYAGTVLGDGTVLIPGGATLPTGTNADIYDPASGTFTTTPNFTAVQAGFREAVLPDGTVLLTSGVDSSGNVVPNSEIYYPVPLAPGIVITTPSTLSNAFVSQLFTQVLLEHGGVGQITWTSSGLPAGFTLTPNGFLTGTPTAAGTVSVPITVTDSGTPPQTLTTTLSLTINPPLAITTTTLPNAPTDGGSPAIPYSAQIQTSGGAGGTLTFSVVAGALPPSITLNPATGLLSSSSVVDPTGTYNFTIQAVSAGPPSATATQAFTLTLVPFFNGNTPNTLPNATESASYTQNITATGGVPPFNFQLSSGSVPPGLSLTTVSPTVAHVSGIPTSAGTFNFTVQGSDSSIPAQVYFEAFTLTVLPQPPTSLTGSPQSPSIITLTWSASPSSDVAGYIIHYGTTAGVYTTTISAGNVNQFAVTGLAQFTTYYFVVDTVSTSGVESSFSNEVAVTTQPSP
ncbi:MAG: kelch repeat-containing protein, partial [Candidatus Dormibacteria bacterium]